MNAQHSSETGEWYTPSEEVEDIREVLEGIDLDPCGSQESNKTVKATMCWGCNLKDPGSLERRWFHENFCRTAFVNPPGACVRFEGRYTVCDNPKKCSCALPKKFLRKCIEESNLGMDIVYLAFSVNQLKQMSRLTVEDPCNISIAIPPKRISFVNPSTGLQAKGMNCDSAFVCLSHRVITHVRFQDVFGTNRGCAIYNRVL